MPNHLSHHFGQSPSDTPESWDKGQPRWVPYHEGLPRHFGVLSVSSGGECPYDPGGGPSGFSGRGPPRLPGGDAPGSLASQEEVPLVCPDPLVEFSLVHLDLSGEVPKVHLVLLEVVL